MKKALSLLLAGVMYWACWLAAAVRTRETPGLHSTPDTRNHRRPGIRPSTPAYRVRPLSGAGGDHHRHRALKQMLTDELAKLGYDVGEVDITVGTSYEAVGEALSAGTADVGLIPGGTYVLYDDGCDVLLTATRDGLSIDSDNAKDWNDNAPTEAHH